MSHVSLECHWNVLSLKVKLILFIFLQLLKIMLPFFRLPNIWTVSFLHCSMYFWSFSYPSSWVTVQGIYVFLTTSLTPPSFLFCCMVFIPFLKIFQIRISCFPNMLHTHHPQTVMEVLECSSLFLTSVLYTPSSQSHNPTKKGVHARYISQSLYLWFTSLTVWLDTEFWVWNNFLSEFRKGAGLLAMTVWLVSLMPVRFLSCCWFLPEVRYI